MRNDLGLLRERRFALLFGARTCSTLGSAIGPVALAFGVLGLPGATPARLSAVLTVYSICQVAFMLLGGAIADRWPRQRLMVVAEAGSTVAWGAIAVMFVVGRAPLEPLLLLSAAAGTATALFFPALAGVVPEVVPAARLQSANALLRLGTNAARLSGFAVAGALVALVGPGWGLMVNAASFAVSGALLAALRLPRVPRDGGGSHIVADLRDGWREFSSRQWLWVVVVQFSFMVAATQAAYGVLGPVVAKAELGGAPAWSAILGAQAVGMMAGVFVAVRLRPRRPILVATLWTLLYALPPALLGLRAPLWAVVAGSFLCGVGFDVFGVLWETTMQRTIPASALSRVSSYDWLGSLLLGPLGLLAAGPLAVTVGTHASLVGCAVVTLVAAAAALLSPGVRRLEWPALPADSGTPAPTTGAATDVRA
ncbi:MFS transporter [Planosporangium sp. 12N6]|uniref:MFS transporter n=1 Tax=Planosporangium spinosum TaxID=3402278 RepID=UPI003CFBB3E7